MRFAQVQGADGTDDAADNEGHENGFDHIPVSLRFAPGCLPCRL